MVRIFILFGILGISQAWGQGSANTPWGNLCGPLVRQYEITHGIPDHLLTAISLVESGRKVGGKVVAWPWTINANGKPYVSATKKEAIIMVRKLQAQGISSIDVGCMQVNLKQHPRAFATLESAFDPATNIAYAAKFLKTKRANQGNWHSAVAHYHSATVKHHLPYREKVLKVWGKMQTAPKNRQGLLYDVSMAMPNYEGKFIHTLSDPSGRLFPMVIRFGPYKGFSKGASEAAGSYSKGIKIIRGWPPRVSGKKASKARRTPNRGLFQVLRSPLMSKKVSHDSFRPKSPTKPGVKSR